MVWDPSKGQNTQNQSFFERFQGPPLAPLVTFKSGQLLVLYQFRCPMAPRFVFGPLSPTQGQKSPKKWLFERKSESGAESESDNRSNSNGWRSPMTLWGWLFLSKLLLSHNSICNSDPWKDSPNCYQHLKVPCLGLPFFRQKKPTKQNKLKQN